MANYYETCRTNYFRVIDEGRYQALFNSLTAEDEIHDFTATRDGVIWHAFGSYSFITFAYIDTDGEEEYDMGLFYDELQDILPDGEAFILMGAGYEKLRYVTGYATVVTKDNIKTVNIKNEALKIARDLLKDPDWKTQMEY